MNLFIVGATGRTGRLLTHAALARGHNVTALVRTATSLSPQTGLRIVEGDPLSEQGIIAALSTDHDVVISTLGSRSRHDDHVLEHGAAAMLNVLRLRGIERYVVVSQALLFPNANPLIAVLRWFLASTVADSTAMEKLIQASDISWTIVRPPRLKEGGRARGYRVCVGARAAGAWSMERADLAAFLVDEAEICNFPRAIVGVG